VSGTRELAHATGATMLLSGEGGPDWTYQYSDKNVQLVKEGDIIQIGNIKIQILHTPGHTPESISFMVTDHLADEAIGVFTGDFLFVGDVGRPDLLEEAAGIMGTREIGAQQQYANVQRFREMPDYLQIWPGHGAGSACGKALGAIPSTTLGYEKRFNPAFQQETEEEFVAWLLDGQPEAPKYFGQMKKVNKEGPALLKDLPELVKLNEVNNGSLAPFDTLVIDTRSPGDFSEKHIPGTINIPFNSGGFATYAGWYVDFEQETHIVAYENEAEAILNALHSVGVDNVPDYFTESLVSAEGEGQITQKTAAEIHEAGFKILDVRGMGEYQAEHISDVIHIHMGYVPNHLDELPRDETLAVHCAGGLRSQVVVSILQKHGFTNVVNMEGGINAWKAAKLPLEQN
jgi:hydroxyacylglutathione hydrolase